MKQYKVSAYKLSLVKDSEIFYESAKLNSSTDSYKLLCKFMNPETTRLQEVFSMVGVNNNNTPIGWYQVSVGGVAGTVVDPRLIFSTALGWMATGIIVCHNHPSGNLTPSSMDIELTRQLVSGGKVLQIKVMDHIIVNGELTDYYSFADNGVIID